MKTIIKNEVTSDRYYWNKEQIWNLKIIKKKFKLVKINVQILTHLFLLIFNFYSRFDEYLILGLRSFLFYNITSNVKVLVYSKS